METTSAPDLTKYRKVKVINTDEAVRLNEHLEGGWEILAVGVNRHVGVFSPGDFRDQFGVLMGHEDPSAT